MPGQRAGHLGRAPTHPRRALPRGRAAHGAFVTAASTEPPRSRAPLPIPHKPRRHPRRNADPHCTAAARRD